MYGELGRGTTALEMYGELGRVTTALEMYGELGRGRSFVASTVHILLFEIHKRCGRMALSKHVTH